MPKKAKRRSGPPPPVAPPPPPQQTTPWPFPYLARYRTPHPTVPGACTTFRTQAMTRFLEGRGEEKWLGLQTMLPSMWPDAFISSTSVLPNGQPNAVKTERWNPWLERLMKGFTNEKYAIRQGDSVFRAITLTGCGAASKTHCAGLYAVAWWAVDPPNSIAVLTSTTKDMIRSRVWSVIRHYATTARDLETGIPLPLGRLVDSQMKLTIDDTGSTNAASISAYAVAHGETAKAVDNLKGLHAKRMLIVIDEANSTPEAIFNVIPNYRKACLDLTVIIIGNPVSRLDPHGRACTPLKGWGGFSEKDVEWATKPIPEWQLDSGLCLRFDGRDSPNVVAGRNRWPYIFTLDNWRQAQARYEQHGGSLAYWSQDRGLWPPDGMASIIFTEQLFLRCGWSDDQPPFIFQTSGETLAFLDPAFGGDACVLQFARLGDVDGRLVLQLTDTIEVPLDPNATSHDLDYQIARFVIIECKTRGVKPECFGLDATGIGRGVGAIIASEWSERIHYTQWGQGATERASAQNDGRPAREVYTTFVGELWFSFRECLEAGQVRGCTRQAIVQFCSREYKMVGKKYRAEPKDEMKARLRFSPDYADADVGVLEVARRNGLVIDNKAMSATAAREWNQTLSATDSIYGITPAEEPFKEDAGWAEVDVEWADNGVMEAG